MDYNDAFATLTGPDGQEIKLPVLRGTMGPPLLDMTGLYAQTGYLTYDPSFSVTGSCQSTISFIDGDQGLLLHRGYPIEQLVGSCDFMDVAHLLVQGQLPDHAQKQAFVAGIKNHTLLHDQVMSFYRGFRRDAHPMAIVLSVVGGLSAFYHESLDLHDPAQRALSSMRLIAKMPTIAAYAYKYVMGQPFMYPCNELSYAENFLHMMFGMPTQPYAVNPVLARALDRLLILHADHEQNASTSTVRMAGSTGANPFACVAAGVAALWGPAHGGANEAVIQMLQDIGTADCIPMYLAKAKDKDDPFRLMGFGHRIYKNYDPRAKIMRQTCHEVLDALGVRDQPLLKLAIELERIALEDEYFVSRKLYPNVDFYSGIILHALGVPTMMYTVLFAVARTVGWVAQWNEMIADPHQRISRPRQMYTGQTQRDIE